MYEVGQISVSLPDNGNQEDGWQWANVAILLKHTESGERPSAEAHVHIRVDDARSLAEAKREARGNALRVLREAVRALEAAS